MALSCSEENYYFMAQTYHVLKKTITLWLKLVLDAYCPHLGANLAVGGHVVKDDIQCPFHLWTFSGTDGKCVSVPYAEKVRSIK